MTPPTDLHEFPDEQSAFDWLYDEVDDPYTDNYRVGYRDDPASMAEYERLESQGCCGSASAEVVIAGRPAVVGLNYGR